MNSNSERDGLAPFLETTPPAWAARSLATVLLSLFACAALAVVFVSVPETVSAPFVLVPVRGGDPVRAFRSGVVGDVRVVETQRIGAGEAMLTITSASIGDRAAEWQGLEAQIQGAQERLASRRQQEASQRLADDQEALKIQARLESLARAMEVRKQQLAMAREMTKRQRETFELGLSSWMETSRVQIEADRLALEVEQAHADESEARRSLQRLRHETAARRAEAHEVERGLIEELERASIRRAALDQDLVRGGNQLVVVAPCAGIVLKLAVRSRGAVVQEGDVLAEVACGGERLRAELTLPQEGIGLVRPGQGVRLLCDAFPYQRYGTRAATIRWISPASAGGDFRAFADVESETVMVQGQPRQLSPGMGGRARVVVGRRTLVSYALGPLRELQENLRGAP
jgi:multidrug efflux pump subunit AcrA (membrane-fusion protein)